MDDYLKILDVGYSDINPLINSRGLHPLDITAGFADFHSSYMGLIHKYSAKYSVNPVVLISEVSKIDKVDVNDEMLDRIAQKIDKENNIFLGKYKFNRYIGHEQNS